jgi:hypothetical protein
VKESEKRKELSSAEKQEVRQKNIRVETSGGSVMHICAQPRKKIKLVQNLREETPETSPSPFPVLSADTHLHTEEKSLNLKVEEELTVHDTLSQDLELLIANNRDTTENQAKSEDFRSSDSYSYNQTSLVKIEEALQAETYSCKEEVQNDSHENPMDNRKNDFTILNDKHFVTELEESDDQLKTARQDEDIRSRCFQCHKYLYSSTCASCGLTPAPGKRALLRCREGCGRVCHHKEACSGLRTPFKRQGIWSCEVCVVVSGGVAPNT